MEEPSALSLKWTENSSPASLPRSTRLLLLKRALEEQKRRADQLSLVTWCEQALAPYGHKPAAHHKLLIAELEQVERGHTRKLMVFMPPGSAKTTYGSVLFPPWFMSRHPNSTVIGASSGSMLADRISGLVQSKIREFPDLLKYKLKTENVQHWRSDNGCEYRSAGAGGLITGFRSDLTIIDDPVKSRKEADSLTIRDAIWNWYNADVIGRARPDARTVIIMTRYHEDDLAGRLLQTDPEGWRVISLPAVAGSDDALGRQPGEWLWEDDDYGFGRSLRSKRAALEAAGSLRDWESLYQQNPRPGEGALFKAESFGIVVVPPISRQVVRAWDLAATEAIGGRDPDYTVGVKLSRLDSGRFIVLDVTRFRGNPRVVTENIVNTAKMDGKSVKIGLPQDPGQAGKAQVHYLVSQLAGFQVQVSPETGAKETRAMPMASQVEAGNVSLVEARWNRAFLEEVSGFPSVAHDDQVDALSRAFSMLVNPAPMMIKPIVFTAPRAY